MHSPLLFAVVSLLALTQTPTLIPDAPKQCESCATWNRDRAPFRVYGNTYYVGTAELSAVLITSPAGHILLDGGLQQSAPLIDSHIRALGFKTTDIKLIVTSHEHYDHVGGVAALQRFSGARVSTSVAGAKALKQGAPNDDDPQKLIPDNGFPAVANVVGIRDGERLNVGDIDVTAHLTPGHTPGSTTWTWRSCEGNVCKDIVYADSLNAVSADDFKFTADPARVAAFQKSIATVEALPCDVLLSVHPNNSGMDAKVAAREKNPAVNAFIDANSCRTYAANARKTLTTRLAAEKK